MKAKKRARMERVLERLNRRISEKEISKEFETKLDAMGEKEIEAALNSYWKGQIQMQKNLETKLGKAV